MKKNKYNQILKAVFERKETLKVQETLDFSQSHKLLEISGWRVGTCLITYKGCLAKHQKEGKARSLYWWCVTAVGLKERAEHGAVTRFWLHHRNLHEPQTKVTEF